MSNINKIIIAVVSCVFMICVASVSIVSIVSSNEKETTTTVPSGELTSDTPDITDQTQGASQTTSASFPEGQSTTAPTSAYPSSTSAPTTSAGGTDYTATGNLAVDILGKWTDSAGMSGYEFSENGIFSWTYVDLEGFGVPFNGKTSGTYTLEGDTLTVKFSIYTATIQKTYRISIAQNELSMFDLEERETSTYMREN